MKSSSPCLHIVHGQLLRLFLWATRGECKCGSCKGCWVQSTSLPCSWIERQQCYYPSSLYEHVLWYEPNYEHVQWYEPNNCGSSVSDCCSRLFNQQHHRTHSFSEQHKYDNWSCEYAAVFNEHCSSSTNSTPFLCNLNGNYSKASSCKITLCYCYGHWSP